MLSQIRSANDRLLAASVNSLIRRAVSLEDPWSSLPEDNITLFCALQTLLPQKLILQKLMEVTTVDVYSLHGFSRSLTSIDLLLANRGQVPLAAASKAAQVCSVCGRNVHASSLCIAKDNINDIKKYVQLRVATVIQDLLQYAFISPLIHPLTQQSMRTPTHLSFHLSSGHCNSIISPHLYSLLISG